MSARWRAKMFHGPVDDVEASFDEWVQKHTDLATAPFISRTAEGQLLMNHSVHVTENGIAVVALYALMSE